MEAMRAWIARRLQPPMCQHKIRLVQSYRAPDRMVGGELVAGETVSQWQMCGRKPNHAGEHGPWSRWYRWRTVASNWIYR